MPGTRKLGKTTDQRMAMLRQQVTDFLDNGRMETTITRAKEIQPIPASSAPASAVAMQRRPLSSNW